MHVSNLRRTAAAAALLALAGVACGTADAAPDPDDGQAALADGEHTVRIVSRDGDTIVVDLLEVLSGQAARDAAVDAGFIRPGEDLPNDVWLEEGEAEAIELTVSRDAAVTLFDCSVECTPRSVDRDGWLAGDVRPLNGAHAVLDLTVTDGEVVSVSEIYLP